MNRRSFVQVLATWGAAIILRCRSAALIQPRAIPRSGARNLDRKRGCHAPWNRCGGHRTIGHWQPTGRGRPHLRSGRAAPFHSSLFASPTGFLFRIPRDIPPVMISVRPFVALALIASLSACGTVMETAQSGYLSDYSALVEAPDASSFSRGATLAINPARVSIEEVVWRAEARAEIDSGERDALLALLRHELQERVQALPISLQGRPAKVRAAITRVETVSPALNTAATLLLIGPLDRGGSAVEIEALDLQTGRQLAALRQGYFAPIGEIKARFSRLAPAEIAIRKAAHDFAKLLRAGTEGSAEMPAPGADGRTRPHGF